MTSSEAPNNPYPVMVFVFYEGLIISGFLKKTLLWDAEDLVANPDVPAELGDPYYVVEFNGNLDSDLLPHGARRLIKDFVHFSYDSADKLWREAAAEKTAAVAEQKPDRQTMCGRPLVAVNWSDLSYG